MLQIKNRCRLLQETASAIAHHSINTMQFLSKSMTRMFLPSPPHAVTQTICSVRFASLKDLIMPYTQSMHQFSTICWQEGDNNLFYWVWGFYISYHLPYVLGLGPYIVLQYIEIKKCLITLTFWKFSHSEVMERSDFVFLKVQFRRLRQNLKKWNKEIPIYEF